MDNFRHLLTILWYKQKNNTNAVWKKNSYGRCSQACCWLQNIIWTLGKQWLTCWHIKQCMNKWTARWHSRYGSRSIKQKKGACTKMLIVVNSGSLASIFFSWAVWQWNRLLQEVSLAPLEVGVLGKHVLQLWREQGYVTSPFCLHCRTPKKVFISILLGQMTQVMAQGERRTHTGAQCLLSRSFHHWLRSTGMFLGDDHFFFYGSFPFRALLKNAYGVLALHSESGVGLDTHKVVARS